MLKATWWLFGKESRIKNDVPIIRNELATGVGDYHEY